MKLLRDLLMLNIDFPLETVIEITKFNFFKSNFPTTIVLEEIILLKSFRFSMEIDKNWASILILFEAMLIRS